MDNEESLEIEQDPENKAGSWKSFLLTIVLAVALVLAVQAFVVKPFKIPSASMLPTFQEGDRILVDRVSPHFQDWQRGDAVVFHPPVGTETQRGCATKASYAQACSKSIDKKDSVYFIKRIVALPGDTFFVKDGVPIVNGKPFVVKKAILSKDCSICNLPRPIKIPQDHYMMMGDNRGNSLDSRVWGSVPKAWIIGKVRARYWPINRIGGAS